jgi:hypothetical protein
MFRKVFSEEHGDYFYKSASASIVRKNIQGEQEI